MSNRVAADKQRASYRAAWGCDCEGDPGDPPPETDPYGKSVATWREQIKLITGYDVDTCPSRTLQDPDCIEVMDAYQWYESGQLAMRLTDDPPNVLIEAIAHYRSAIQLVANNDREVRRQNAEQKRKKRA